VAQATHQRSVGVDGVERVVAAERVVELDELAAIAGALPLGDLDVAWAPKAEAARAAAAAPRKRVLKDVMGEGLSRRWRDQDPGLAV
jgi:hypothetical protein